MENCVTADNCSLQVKNVFDITGHFVVKDYQRGYRWRKGNVCLLLEDIIRHEDDKSYCLQPVVVRKVGDDTFELIDGQQRLTTLYILRCMLLDEDPGREIGFSISYDIRPDSGRFLEKIHDTDWTDPDDVEALRKESEKNIDFSFMFNAAYTVREWFLEKTDACTTLKDIKMAMINKLKKRLSYGSKRNRLQDSGTCIIWYESNDTEPEELFRRLNVGKIPLTNSELIKALFLKDDTKTPESNELKARIAREWDEITHTLMDDSYWYFISNESPEKYSTRIDRLFELYTGKPAYGDDQDPYALFFAFSEQMQSDQDDEEDNNQISFIWEQIRLINSTLLNWYSSNELYDKIGYLIATASVDLKKLLDLSSKMKKSEFREEIEKLIRYSIALPDSSKSYLSLVYGNDSYLLDKILLLFNVLSLIPKETEQSEKGSIAGRFDFRRYKAEKWSLEHIHAQQSQIIKSNADKLEWVKNQKASLDSMIKEGLFSEQGDAMELSNKMAKILAAKDRRNPFEGVDFESLLTDVFRLSPKREENSEDYDLKDHLGNLALLSQSANSALNNSTFDVKRRMIIEMDKAGAFIPLCTKNVFLKYYSISGDTNLHFWELSDQKAYVDEIGEVLKLYLQEEIKWQSVK